MWYGHVMGRGEHYVGRRAIEMKVQGRRKRGRPKRRWLDKVRDDIKEKGLSADEVYDRVTWRRVSSYTDPSALPGFFWGGATRPTPHSLASVVHTFEAVAGN